MGNKKGEDENKCNRRDSQQSKDLVLGVENGADKWKEHGMGTRKVEMWSESV